VRLKQTHFSIQLDESTDTARQAQLLDVQHCWDGEMIEDFMFCHQMQSRTTDLDVFNVLCDFFTIRTVVGVMCGHIVPTVQLQWLASTRVLERISEKKYQTLYKRTAWFIAKCLLRNI